MNLHTCTEAVERCGSNEKKDIPNAILFTVPNVHCNTSSGSRIKKKICSGRTKVSLCNRKVNNQNIP